MRSLRLATILVALTCTASDAQVIVVETRSPAIGTDGRLTENVGIETLGGVFTTLLREGCAIPCSTVQTFSTADDNQTGIKILYRGRARLAAQAHRLGSFEIIGIPLAPRGKPSIRVSISIENGNIVLSAVDALSGKRLEVTRLD